MTMTRFIRVGIAAAAATAFAFSAQAADMRPVYKAAPPVAAYSWSGCYIGGQLGGQLYRFPALPTDHFNTTGKFGTQASLRLKGGVAFDRMLIYVAGGVTWANLSATHNFFRDGDGSLAFSSSTSRTGWNLGVGL